MDLATLKQRFARLVAPGLSNDWEVDEALLPLLALTDAELAAVLAQVGVIWPVSQSLCFSYLQEVANAVPVLGPEGLAPWVGDLLDRYERDGLRAAQRFMGDTANRVANRTGMGQELRFEAIQGRLQPYIQGLAGRNMELAVADQVYTDTATIFLPPQVLAIDSERSAFLLYKLIATYQWGFIAAATFTPRPDAPPAARQEHGTHWLSELLHRYPDPQLAGFAYHLLETVRVTGFLKRQVPGLMRESRRLRQVLCQAAQQGRSLGLLSELWAWLGRGSGAVGDPLLAGALDQLASEQGTAVMSLGILSRFACLLPDADRLCLPPPPLFQGQLRLAEVQAALERRRGQERQRFIDGLATLLMHHFEQIGPLNQELVEAGGTASQAADLALVLDGQGKGRGHQETSQLRLGNQELELDQELGLLAQQIVDDLGQLPSSYVQAAVGQAGAGLAAGPGQAADGTSLDAPVTYDEWDYRRQGYRRDWCQVRERELAAVRSSFLDVTLARYGGQIRRLRHQFALMRTSEYFVRRQRDGDEIDFDAVVDALADSRAGLATTDRLYIRLQRDERDIATCFLVDMSNSTQGWVGQTIKQSLVLLSEAMEALGDRYAIYGFSGMRRLRCDIYHVKHLDERYDDRVRQRISAIGPREYTRMAPAIRHLSRRLDRVDAKVRLLVVLSDGKPEDYDQYKGIYAIEDTRHALLEARSLGIHPFGITIDRHAHAYMAHMYGAFSYIYIDDILRLPARIPEIYRSLTT